MTTPDSAAQRPPSEEPAGAPTLPAAQRTRAQLADGREIFFFDDAPRRRTVQDRREISRPVGGNEMRYDPLLREWVAIAAARQHRTHLPATAECPLCPSTPKRATEVPQDQYDVVVFENRFPSFRGDIPIPEDLLSTRTAAQETAGLRQPGSGRCEVVCFTDQHSSALGQVSLRRMRTVLDAWADRTAAMLAEPGVEQVYCFENRGEEIGVTLNHPHGQIYGYPFITPRTRTLLDSAADFRARRGADLFAEVLAGEVADGRRIVARTAHWTAFVPAWARWPVELHIYPHRAVERLPELTDAERDDFAALYLDLLRRGDQLFDAPLPYISGWQQAPASAEPGLMRLHLQLFSIRRAENKLKYLAGSESGMGVFINDIAPEETARRLVAIGPQTAESGSATPTDTEETP
ncbi:galactose-1-phosphate uridylyltransferase [Nesterenkonia sp. E16_7]|uniref:galactose-1-phosphate uridylyltransferase n=1 Tax=unclassified Nesterenkonia TaxID=2629769 RepID=UPI001A9232FA|nr:MULTISPECIES: galactose-1-phosphate uridylyltransferase [unclassified Nesterenkonia]MBO0595013.1 galactose-1-phosphate uridylyltransferase [Nesterenkonia sp. E16_10]MBO0598668.1 galactose-1-phosphate uridylyltransferase [Nesterenkonia sp. E16_7]